MSPAKSNGTIPSSSYCNAHINAELQSQVNPIICVVAGLSPACVKISMVVGIKIV